MLLGYVCEIAAMIAITGIVDIYAKGVSVLYSHSYFWLTCALTESNPNIVTNQAEGGLYICADVNIPPFYHLYLLWLPVVVYESILYLFVLWYGVGHWMSGYRIQQMNDRVSVTDGLVTGNASYFLWYV